MKAAGREPGRGPGKNGAEWETKGRDNKRQIRGVGRGG